MPKIVYLPTRAFVGEKSQYVKRYRYRHFFYGLGLFAVLDIRMNELRCRHGFRYAPVTLEQNLIPDFFSCQQVCELFVAPPRRAAAPLQRAGSAPTAAGRMR